MNILWGENLRALMFAGVVTCLLSAVSGCGKKSPPPLAPATVENNSAPSAAPRSSVAPPSRLELAPNATAEDATGQLSMELRRYVLSTRTIPKNFDDFVARHPMKFPPPPAGKHYAIEEGKVVLR
jgi:hypothetical protein